MSAVVAPHCGVNVFGVTLHLDFQAARRCCPTRLVRGSGSQLQQIRVSRHPLLFLADAKVRQSSSVHALEAPVMEALPPHLIVASSRFQGVRRRTGGGIYL